MPSTNVYYYTFNSHNPFKDFLDSLNKQQQAKILRIIQNIYNYGLTSAIPHLKKVTGTPFWEIRVLGKDNLRAIYIHPNLNSILILHGFIKKTQKTPQKEIQIAFNRYRQWQNKT